MDYSQLQPRQHVMEGCVLTRLWLGALSTSSTRSLKSRDKKRRASPTQTHKIHYMQPCIIKVA